MSAPSGPLKSLCPSRLIAKDKTSTTGKETTIEMMYLCRFSEHEKNNMLKDNAMSFAANTRTL